MKEQEFALIRTYTSIQNQRFDNRIHLSVHIPECFKNAVVWQHYDYFLNKSFAPFANLNYRLFFISSIRSFIFAAIFFPVW